MVIKKHENRSLQTIPVIKGRAPQWSRWKWEMMTQSRCSVKSLSKYKIKIITVYIKTYNLIL